MDTTKKLETILNSAEASAISGSIDAAEATAGLANPNNPASLSELAGSVKILGDAVKQLVSILEKTPR